LLYIFDPSPQLRVHMSKTLTATYFCENFVPPLLLERLADVLPPRGVEPVTELVPRVGVICSHTTTMPCDVLSSFPLSPNQAEVPVCGVLHHTVCLVRKSMPARSYDGGPVGKRPQGGLCSYLPLHLGNTFSSSMTYLTFPVGITAYPSRGLLSPINHTSLCPSSSRT